MEGKIYGVTQEVDYKLPEMKHSLMDAFGHCLQLSVSNTMGHLHTSLLLDDELC